MSTLPALSTLDVLVLDCQATAAAPRGQLLELGWARALGEPLRVCSALIRLPGGAEVPRAVQRVTGITTGAAAGGVGAAEAFRCLREHARALGEPAPAVAHFARFERPFLDAGGAGSAVELLCTHEVARRLFPTLPRRSLRALSGYFGHAVSPLRRAAEHVEATAHLWRSLVPLLQARGVGSWSALKAFLAQPVARPERARYGWPMPREKRLALPAAPGLYRLLRGGGAVLYVGKATSLRQRVNGYFRKQRGVHERTLEMLSQARDLSYQVAESPLEAALLEPDEIKAHRPPYNVAHLEQGRQVWFASPDWRERRPHPTARCPIGPFPSPELLDQAAALACGEASALGRHGPGPALFAAGLARFRAAHPELSQLQAPPLSRLLRLGARLWREGRRARDDGERAQARAEGPAPAPRWTIELTQQALEWLALRAAHGLRRARWLTRLCEASLAWVEPRAGPRCLRLEGGALLSREAVPKLAPPPAPARHALTAAARHQGFDVARLDRLRVLTTELKRLADEGVPLLLSLGPRQVLDRAGLARVLEWL